VLAGEVASFALAFVCAVAGSNVVLSIVGSVWPAATTGRRKPVTLGSRGSRPESAIAQGGIGQGASSAGCFRFAPTAWSPELASRRMTLPPASWHRLLKIG